MELCVSLFGKKKEVLGWLELFQQEKNPFKYKGQRLREFSSINILVGFKKEVIKNFTGDKKVFILEPPIDFKNEKISGDKKTPKLLIQQTNNLLIISRNISSLLLTNRSNRQEILDVLRGVLLRALKLKSLPYVHVWYYPQPCKTIFLFRQDADYVNKEGVENLIRITSKFDIRGTYFVNISGEEEFDEEIGHLTLSKPTTPERKGTLLKLINQNNEIANHGYWHYVFGDFENNFQNIKKCDRYLYNLFHIKTKGFASPGAEWNKNLARAIEKSKLLYSSNGLSDGGLPYYPYLNGRKTKTLEIPFYYFCDASFEQTNSQKFQKILRDYYLTLVQKNIDHNGPIAIVGHPHLIGKTAESFYLPLFEKIQKLKIPNYTIEEFASWWKKREGIKLSCRKLKDKLIVESNKSDFFIRIIHRKNQSVLKINRGKKVTVSL